MSKQTTRRAVLAGTAALPTLAVPALADANDDAAIIAAGERLRRGMLVEERAHAAYLHHRAPFDAMLDAARTTLETDNDYEAYYAKQKSALSSPEYASLKPSYDRWSKIAGINHSAAKALLREYPTTARAFGYVVLAWLYQTMSYEPDLPYDSALLAEKAAQVGGFDLPSEVAGVARKEIERVEAIESNPEEAAT